jgi:hypothetical protein
MVHTPHTAPQRKPRQRGGEAEEIVIVNKPEGMSDVHVSDVRVLVGLQADDVYEDGLVKLKKIWDESAVASVKQQKTTLEKKVSSLVKDTQKALKKVRPQSDVTHNKTLYTGSDLLGDEHMFTLRLQESTVFCHA